MARARSAKFEIDKARKSKAAAKRDKRAQKGDEVPGENGGEAAASHDEVLAALADLQARYDAEEIDVDEFADTRAELLSRLQVD